MTRINEKFMCHEQHKLDIGYEWEYSFLPFSEKQMIVRVAISCKVSYNK